MNKLHGAVPAVAGLVIGVFLGIWIVGRSHSGRHDANGGERNALASSETMPTEGKDSVKRPFTAKDTLRGNTPHVPPRLPAPKIVAQHAETTPPSNASPSWLTQLFKGDATNKVTLKQIGAYLHESKRSAASLLAAARVTGDRTFLREAAERFPNDPHVLLDWLSFGAATPAERRQALDAFRQAAPNNALGDYLAALDLFENGNIDEAVRAMWPAFQKTDMQDYALDTVQDREEAYLAAGYSPAQAGAAAFYGTEIPQASRLRALSRSLLDLQKQYAQAGDGQSAQVVAEMGIRLGSQMQQQMGHLLIEELVGMVIERSALERVDPNAILEATGQTVALRLKQLEQRKNTIKDLAAIDLTKLDEREIHNFTERAKLYGEFDALRWLQEKHGGGIATP